MKDPVKVFLYEVFGYSVIVDGVPMDRIWGELSGKIMETAERPGDLISWRDSDGMSKKYVVKPSLVRNNKELKKIIENLPPHLRVEEKFRYPYHIVNATFFANMKMKEIYEYLKKNVEPLFPNGEVKMTNIENENLWHYTLEDRLFRLDVTNRLKVPDKSSKIISADFFISENIINKINCAVENYKRN